MMRARSFSFGLSFSLSLVFDFAAPCTNPVMAHNSVSTLKIIARRGRDIGLILFRKKNGFRKRIVTRRTRDCINVPAERESDENRAGGLDASFVGTRLRGCAKVGRDVAEGRV